MMHHWYATHTFSTIDDSVFQNGTLLFTDDATIQCVAVSVSSICSDATDEEACLTLTLSTMTTVSGLSLSPDRATICLVSMDGKHPVYMTSIIYNFIQ